MIDYYSIVVVIRDDIIYSSDTSDLQLRSQTVSQLEPYPSLEQPRERLQDQQNYDQFQCLLCQSFWKLLFLPKRVKY